VVAAAYFNNISIIFLGGFIMALAMERWNLHKRIALTVMVKTGKNLGFLLFGFMSIGYLMSMWASNTATALILIPNGIAIVDRLEKSTKKENVRPFSVGLFLGIAFSCNIGGISTTVGTPPNLIFFQQFQKFFPNLPLPSFFQWLVYGVGLSLFFEIILYLLIYVFYVLRTYYYIKKSKREELKINGGEADESSSSLIDISPLKEELKNLGSMKFEEYVVSFAFLILIILWITRSGVGSIPGWGKFFLNYPTDGTAAVLVSFFLFLIPIKNYPKDPETDEIDTKANCVMDWNSMINFPWDIILLFGGGFAMADGFIVSGLSEFIAQKMILLKDVPVILLIGLVCSTVVTVTSVTSNIATTQIFLPILSSLSVAVNIHPLYLMIPATISASFAFLLPVSTGPNMIAFTTKRLTVLDMAILGFCLSIIGSILVTIYSYFVIPLIFDITLK
jgi:solute carrier family 13 (sodium-dependent dicarboxylate transporter), member 2/3/5